MSWWKVAEKPALQTPEDRHVMASDDTRTKRFPTFWRKLPILPFLVFSEQFPVVTQSSEKVIHPYIRSVKTITQSLAVSLEEGLCVKSVGSNSRGLWETDSPSCSANTVVIAATRPCSSLWYRCRIVVMWHIKTPLLHNSSYTTAVPRMAQQQELFKSTEDARRSKLLLFILHKLQRILVK